jgi:hypothetical protein
VTPVLAESAKHYSFGIADHSAALLRWGPWPVALAAGSALVILFVNGWWLKPTRVKLVCHLLLLASLLGFSLFYGYSVLVAPQLELQQFMNALNQAALTVGGS